MPVPSSLAQRPNWTVISAFLLLVSGSARGRQPMIDERLHRPSARCAEVPVEPSRARRSRRRVRSRGRREPDEQGRARLRRVRGSLAGPQSPPVVLALGLRECEPQRLLKGPEHLILRPSRAQDRAPSTRPRHPAAEEETAQRRGQRSSDTVHQEPAPPNGADSCRVWLSAQQSAGDGGRSRESAPWNGADSCRVGWAPSGAAGDGGRATCAT